MTADDVKQFALKNENQVLEFKYYKNKLNIDIFETVCSFANREGGNIFIGIEDKTHKILGVDKEDVEKFKTDFLNQVSNPNKISPRLTYELQEVLVDTKIVLYTTIYPSPVVHKLNGTQIMDRQGEADKDITDTPDLVANMYIRKRDGYSENQIYPFCKMSSLNEDLINRARKMALVKNAKHPWKEMDNLELLKSAGLYLENPLTGEQGFTLASILLFGKDETIISVCPQYRTDCIKRIKNLDRYDDRDDIRTNLIDTYYRMMDFIKKHLDEGFALDELSTRYSPRDYLFREAISNILIHREFRDRTTATMTIEKDKVVFVNGCIPYRHGDITLHNFSPISKNPRIAYVFNNIGLADELGSGVRNMYKYCKIYTDSYPIIKEGEVFVTTIPLISTAKEHQVFDEQVKIIIDYIKINGKIDSQKIKELLNLEKSRVSEILNNLLLEKKIYRHGKGKATFYDFNEVENN